VTNEGGTVGDVSLGRYSTIIKPLSIRPRPDHHKPFVYTVAAGENLSAIAAKYHVTGDRSAVEHQPDGHGNGRDRRPVEHPPVPGIVITTKASDTFDSLGVKSR